MPAQMEALERSLRRAGAVKSDSGRAASCPVRLSEAGRNRSFTHTIYIDGRPQTAPHRCAAIGRHLDVGRNASYILNEFNAHRATNPRSLNADRAANGGRRDD